MRPMDKFRAVEDILSRDEQQRIVKINAFADKPMLPEEARLELQLGKRDFIMFKNADTGEPNVLYKKEGGVYGLIEPKF